MSNPNKLQLPLRGDRWLGLDKESKATVGMPRLVRAENCYVSKDGQELRRMPGFKTSADFSEAYDPAARLDTGYHRLVEDAARNVITSAGTYPFEYAEPVAIAERLFVRNKPTHMHCFEFVRSKLVVVGESDFRREPIRTGSSTGNDVLISSWAVAGTDSTTLTLTATAFGGPDWHGIAPGDSIYIEDIPSSESEASVLNDKFHYVTATGALQITINTGTVANSSGSGLNGKISRARVSKQVQAPGTPYTGGRAYYVGDADYEIEDDDSLTIYTAEGFPDTDGTDPLGECFPAYVANRQRDFGDPIASSGGSGDFRENGWNTSGTPFYQGVRRKPKTLPFRVNPDVAGDRLLLAAPGYGCIFQCPVILPPDSNFSSVGSGGIDVAYNDLYDKPRSLGMPKATIVHFHVDDGSNDTELIYEAHADHVLPTASTMEGSAYKVMVAYKDEGTGEVGLASEPITVTVPSTAGDTSIRIFVLHPGYLLAECLGFSYEVFVTGADGEVFGHLLTAPGSIHNSTVGNTAFDILSCKYGISSGSWSAGSSTADLYALNNLLVEIQLPPWDEDDIDFDYIEDDMV